MTLFFHQLEQHTAFITDTGRMPRVARQVWLKTSDDSARLIGLIALEPIGKPVKFETHYEVKVVRLC